MPGNWGLIDLETPDSVYTIQSFRDPSTELQLVFSDEFNEEGRSFYPGRVYLVLRTCDGHLVGDDPYWEAVDLHYWQVCSSAEI